MPPVPAASREADRLWERHVLNSAALSLAIEPGSARTLADVGSGAGLPGLVVAIARPDLRVTLIEAMERRTTWLTEVVADLGLDVEIVRARAEELHGSRVFDVVTARAVAALDKLARWTMPLVAPGGRLMPLKGASAQAEIDKAWPRLRRMGAVDVRVLHAGSELLEAPTTVVEVRTRAPESKTEG